VARAQYDLSEGVDIDVMVNLNEEGKLL